MRTSLAAFIAVIATLQTWNAHADPEECQEAVERYNTAIDDVSDHLRIYSRCVSDSRGHDDCSSEFMSLHSAQDDFETAVQDYGSDCQ